MQPRKTLRLVDYDYSQPGAYFITVCTKDRAHILGAIVGADDHIGPYVRLSTVGKLVDQYTHSIPGIDRYVIMPDHVHMIILFSSSDILQGPMWSSAPTKTNISTIIRSWKTMITKALGKNIWQRSYYDHVIRGEQDYWEIVKYMEENPGKWYYTHHDN